MNKSAKEMFEKLGYKLYRDKNVDTYFEYRSRRYVIIFYLDTKEFTKTEILQEDEVGFIGIGEHKAIIQQCKELKWLDE